MHDLEADVIIQDHHNCDLIREEFTKSAKPENLLSKKHLSELPVWDRILAQLYFVFRYWF